MKKTIRRIALALVGLAVVGGIGYGLMPPAVSADLAIVERGNLRVTVDEDGKTRIRERYIVSAPLAGRLSRIELEPGDAVFAGETLLATIEPRDPDLLDARAVLQAEANVKAAQARLDRTTPLLEEAVAQQELAEAELRRLREMRAAAPGSVSASQLDAATTAQRSRGAAVRSAQHAEEIARFELQQAEAVLARSRPEETYAPQGADPKSPPPPSVAAQNLAIFAPIDGRVLRVFQESSAVVTPGTQLLELGDPDDLEVEIDVLSRDGIKIREGAEATFEHWGGEKPLAGRIRLVEPSAFTKISTLGVEEQRVNVIADLDPPRSTRCAGRRLSRRGAHCRRRSRQRPENSCQRPVSHGRGVERLLRRPRTSPAAPGRRRTAKRGRRRNPRRTSRGRRDRRPSQRRRCRRDRNRPALAERSRWTRPTRGACRATR